MGVDSMYDRHLDAFVAVAELGSFAKAGESLHLTANAVIKQVNCLERDLGFALFSRSTRGTVLTPAGRVAYQGALRIIADAREVVQRARSFAGAAPRKVRLACSAMRSVEKIGAWWAEVGAEHPHIGLEIVPVPDDARFVPTVYARVGKDIDVLLTIEPCTPQALVAGCELREVFRSPGCIAVPIGHRLAAADRLTMGDLRGERLYLTVRGCTSETDRLRDALGGMGRDAVDIVDCRPYDAEVFNRAARDGALVLHCVELGRVHPAYVNKPLEGLADFPFCLVYQGDCDPAVREFVDAVVCCASN